MNSTIDKSYGNRVRRGDRVRLTEEVKQNGETYQVGTMATVLSESNGGFRGIEASLIMGDQTRIYNISTGKFQVQL